jgi:hypothetical protein
MLDEIFLHIGTEKTGTTSIQLFLDANHQTLNSLGFGYPKSLGGARQILLPAYARGSARRAGKGFERLASAKLGGNVFHGERMRIAETLAEELAAYDPHIKKVILSSEYLHSRLQDPEELSRIEDLLAPLAHRVTVVAYVRRQDRVARSLASTYAKGDDQRAYEVFRPVNPDNLPRYFDYFRLFEEYQKFVQPDKILVRVFDKRLWKNNDLISDFLSTIGIPSDADFTRLPQANSSLSPKAIEFLHHMVQHVPRFQGDRPNPVRQQLIDLMEEKYPGGGPQVSRETARTFYANFAKSNERLSKEYFGMDSGCVFDDDFSEYPETAGVTLSRDEVLEITGYLFNRQEERCIELLVDNFILRGRMQLREQKYLAAKKTFKQVLSYVPEHKRALELIDLCEKKKPA